MKTLTSCLIACAAISSVASVAAAQQSSGPVSLNIAAQPLTQALTQLAVAADLKLVYWADVGVGLRAPAVIGRFTPAASPPKLLTHKPPRRNFISAHTRVISNNGPQPPVEDTTASNS